MVEQIEGVASMVKLKYVGRVKWTKADRYTVGPLRANGWRRAEIRLEQVDVRSE